MHASPFDIRHSEPSDIPAIRALYAQPSAYANTLQLPWPSLQRWERFLGDPPEHFHSLVACRDGRLLGQLGLEVFANPRRRHAANLGMAVDEHARRQGVADALVRAAIQLATGWLAVRRLELEVYTDNEAAIALYQKHGFRIEGTATGYAYRDGGYADVHLMARTTD